MAERPEVARLRDWLHQQCLARGICAGYPKVRAAAIRAALGLGITQEEAEGLFRWVDDYEHSHRNKLVKHALEDREALEDVLRCLEVADEICASRGRTARSAAPDDPPAHYTNQPDASPEAKPEAGETIEQAVARHWRARTYLTVGSLAWHCGIAEVRAREILAGAGFRLDGPRSSGRPA